MAPLNNLSLPKAVPQEPMALLPPEPMVPLVPLVPQEECMVRLNNRLLPKELMAPPSNPLILLNNNELEPLEVTLPKEVPLELMEPPSNPLILLKVDLNSLPTLPNKDNKVDIPLKVDLNSLPILPNKDNKVVIPLKVDLNSLPTLPNKVVLLNTDNRVVTPLPNTDNRVVILPNKVAIPLNRVVILPKEVLLAMEPPSNPLIPLNKDNRVVILPNKGNNLLNSKRVNILINILFQMTKFFVNRVLFSIPKN